MAPVRLSCTAVSGAITTSSWSWAPLEPLAFSVPTTVKVWPLSWTFWPSGFWPPNRLVITVWPTTTTLLCWFTSSWVKNVPVAVW